jgi:hypothetical protein
MLSLFEASNWAKAERLALSMIVAPADSRMGRAASKAARTGASLAPLKMALRGIPRRAPLSAERVQAAA